MQENLEPLLEIEEIDRKILEHNKTLRELKKTFEISNKSNLNSKSAFSKLDGKFKQIERQVKECETLIQIENGKKKSLEEKMMAVKNQKEYLSLKKEIETIEKVVNEMEEMILNLEGQKEEEQAEYDKLKQDFEKNKSDFDKNESHFSKENESLSKIKKALEDEKKSILSNIDKKLAKQYERLHRSAFIPPVVKITSTVCTGCRMNIPAQDYNIILQKKIGECIHCHRILIYQEPEEKEETEAEGSAT